MDNDINDMNNAPTTHTTNINIRTADGRSIEVDHVEDVDLDRELVTLKNGHRLDEEGAEDLAAEILEAAGRPLPTHLRRAGRPSLSGVGGKTSPRVAFRVSHELENEAEQEARRRGIRVSQLAREALEAALRTSAHERRVSVPKGTDTGTSIRR